MNKQKESRVKEAYKPILSSLNSEETKRRLLKKLETKGFSKILLTPTNDMDGVGKPISSKDRAEKIKIGFLGSSGNYGDRTLVLGVWVSENYSFLKDFVKDFMNNFNGEMLSKVN